MEEFKDLNHGRSGERGYALVGLMAVMLFALILTTAAAPAIKYESQREREEEMFWRGQQIQRALQLYTSLRRNQYPTNLADLTEAINDGTKKVRLLRSSALCDPMTPCEQGESNWHLVHPGDPLPNELLTALTAFQQKMQMQGGPNIQLPPELRRFAQMGAVQLPGQEGKEGDDQDQKDQNKDATPPPGGGNGFGIGSGAGPGNSMGFDPSNQKPIIGVVSNKSDQMFRSYYGINAYDHALFFPGVPVVAGGFNRAAFAVPLGQSVGAANSVGTAGAAGTAGTAGTAGAAPGGQQRGNPTSQGAPPK